ncbi:MAG TPA: substrate-binding domain-containing protein [Methanosarcina sp.]|nr:substrate-binding domain-containing protein [Methanosarcina sp.]
MKKIFLIISVVLLLALILGACAPAAPATQAPPAQPTVGKAPLEAGMVDTTKYKKDGKVTIGVSYEGPLNDYSKSMLYHIQYQLQDAYASRVGKLIIAAADGDAARQINDVENLLTQKIDLLLYQPISESAGVAVVEKAMSMGVPVVIFGAHLLTEEYVSYVNIDNTGIGYAYTDWIAKQIGGKGKVVVMMGEAGSGYTEDTYRGVQEALKKYPDIKPLPTTYANYSQATAKQQMETLLNANDDIVGAIVQGGHMGLGILEAYLDKGKEPPFMSVDDINLFMKAAKKYNFTKFITYGAGAEVSFDAAKIAMDILDGKPVKKDYLSPVELFTAQQMAERIPEGMPDGFWSLAKIPKDKLKDYFKE